MKKIDIVDRYANMKGISKKDATDIVESVIGIITTGVEDDGVVDLYGFGKFTVETIPERTRKYTMGNKKGQEYTTPEHKKVKFKAAKALTTAVNG